MLSSRCLRLRIPSWHAPNDQLVNGPTHSLVGPNKRQCTKIKNNKICFCPVYLSKARPRWQWKSRLLVKQQDLCCKKYFIQFYQCKGNSHRTIINEIYTALHILKRIFLQYIYRWKPPLSKANQVWVYPPFLFCGFKGFITLTPFALIFSLAGGHPSHRILCQLTYHCKF